MGGEIQPIHGQIEPDIKKLRKHSSFPSFLSFLSFSIFNLTLCGVNVYLCKMIFCVLHDEIFPKF